MNIIIKKANEGDLLKIRELNMKLFELEREQFVADLIIDKTCETGSEDYLKDMIENKIVLLAVTNNEIIGYLTGVIESNNHDAMSFARLKNIYILENYRKCGIGSKLINEFKKLCLEKGITILKVTTYAKNKIATSFYNKNGFEDWDITLKCKI